MSKKIVKIKVNLPGGAVMEIEGEEDSAAKTAIEVARQLQYVPRNEMGGTSKRKPSGLPRTRPKDVLVSLVEQGFFNEWRTIDEVAKKMNEDASTVEGRGISAVAVTLNRWAAGGKYGLMKEELAEEEKMRGKGGSRYRVKQTQKHLINKDNKEVQ